MERLHKVLKTIKTEDNEVSFKEPLEELLDWFEGLKVFSAVTKRLVTRLLSYWKPEQFIGIEPLELDKFLETIDENPLGNKEYFNVAQYTRVLNIMKEIKDQINDLKPRDMVDLEIFYRNDEPGRPKPKGQEPQIFNPPPRPNALNLILYGPPGTGKTYELLHTYVPMFEREGAKRWAMVTFHQSYGYEDFVEGLKPVAGTEENSGQVTYKVVDGIFKRMVKRAVDDPNNRYALFVDEINRANISKVFGELITLLEEDKRLHWDSKNGWTGLRLELPYTHTDAPDVEPFGVPDNLYVIGAMNTADRSIAVLDTALRRRFEFQELMPKPDKLPTKTFSVNNSEIDMVELLEAMNRRIAALYDREHQIGHSYFWNVDNFDDLKKVFLKKIIPLLQEYFFDEWEKIKLVLKDPEDNAGNPIFKRIKIDINKEFPGFQGDPSALELVYDMPKDITPDQIIRIYKG
jgi:5-methylcytosine-specific restriction protein B